MPPTAILGDLDIPGCSVPPVLSFSDDALYSYDSIDMTLVSGQPGSLFIVWISSELLPFPIVTNRGPWYLTYLWPLATSTFPASGTFEMEVYTGDLSFIPYPLPVYLQAGTECANKFSNLAELTLYPEVVPQVAVLDQIGSGTHTDGNPGMLSHVDLFSSWSLAATIVDVPVDGLLHTVSQVVYGSTAGLDGADFDLLDYEIHVWNDVASFLGNDLLNLTHLLSES